jgi:hypothetical protein
MSAKDIVLRPITSAEARKVVEREHYSGKTVQNSQLHIGVFYGGVLEGAMQFGPSLDKRKIAGLVRETGWHQFLELNRMAFSERLPRNSESRALGVAMRLIAKHAPQVKWVVSFADATQCGDGTIYRASGFLLTGIKSNNQVWELPDGKVVSRTTMTKGQHTAGSSGAASMRAVVALGGKPIPGYQFRYIRFIDPTWRDRLTVPVVPFDKIPPECKMYRGSKMGGGPKGTGGDQPPDGGASPTPPLHGGNDVAP